MSAVTGLQSLMNAGSIPPTPLMSLGYNRIIPSVSKSAFTSLGSLGGPSQPAPAAASGYNFLSFYDDFTTIGTIDITDSRAVGFNAYIHGAWPLAPGGVASWPIAHPDDVSISSSVVTFNNQHAPGGGAQLWSSAPTGTGSTYIGNVFTNGFYYESRIKFDATLATIGAQSSGWPAVWSLPVEWLTAAIVRYVEPDYFEAFPTGTGTFSPLMSLHDVAMNPGGPVYSNTNNAPSLGGTDWTQFHTIGALWIPMAKNGGTGLFKRYFDGTHLTAQDVTYSASGPPTPDTGYPNGTYSPWDSENMVLLIAAGYNWPTLVDYVQVWQ